MFPTELSTVVLIIGLLLVSIISNKGLLMILTGFVILFADLQNTSNYLETMTMAVIAITIMFYGLTTKEK